MSYTKVNWKNGEEGNTPINDVNLKKMDEQIFELDQNKISIIELLTVSETAPATCSTGDKYYNTTTNKIYIATDENTWGTTGEDPSSVYLYIDLKHENIYFYDGTTFKSYGGGGAASGDTLPIGSIVPYGNKEAPTNWLSCNGQAVSRTTYADLFAIIGTQFGSGDGSTTFNLPDLNQYRVPIGYDRTEEQSNRMNLGTTGGEEKHTMTIEELVNHGHNTSSTMYTGTGSLGYGNIRTEITVNGAVDKEKNLSTSNVGEGQPFNIMQPYVTTNYIIKAFQSVGVIANVSQTKTTSDTDTYSCTYVNSIDDKVDKATNYSNEEVAIGKWTDGKTLYRKTITRTVTATSNDFINLDLSISSNYFLTTPPKIMIYHTGSNSCTDFTWFDKASIDMYMDRPTNGNYKLYFKPNVNDLAGTYYITLEYTK